MRFVSKEHLHVQISRQVNKDDALPLCVTELHFIGTSSVEDDQARFTLTRSLLGTCRP